MGSLCFFVVLQSGGHETVNLQNRSHFFPQYITVMHKWESSYLKSARGFRNEELTSSSISVSNYGSLTVLAKESRGCL